MIDWTKPIQLIKDENVTVEVLKIMDYGDAVLYWRTHVGVHNLDFVSPGDERFRNVHSLSDRVTEELAKVQIGNEVRVWGKDVHESFRGKTIRVRDIFSDGIYADSLDISRDHVYTFRKDDYVHPDISAFITPADYTPEMAEALRKEREG